jgi:hypothetical protein
MSGKIETLTLAVFLGWLFWMPTNSLGQNISDPTEQGVLVGARTGGAMAVCNIPFVGQASGGTLILADTLGRNARFVAIETSRGESAESVVKRLAKAINEQDPFEWQHHTVTSSGGTLMTLIGSVINYITAGTELDLGIPMPPTSVTCNYDHNGRVVIRWKNPPGGYDSVRVLTNHTNYNHTSGALLAGDVEAYEINLNVTQPEPELNEARKKMIADLDIWVSGVRGDIPSNAAAMHVSYNVQEERYGIPFSNNTSPNWTAWSLNPRDVEHVGAGVRDRLTATKNNRFYNNVDAADQKPFYQILKPHRGGPAGITRSFLGLTPGHKYRVTVRMNTYGVDAKSTNWAYSFHAVCTGAEDRPLSPQQMVGQKPLPSRAKGFEESRIVQYDDKKRTKSAYNESVKELVVPESADAITVWLTFRSARPDDYVTMDYIKLEDLGKQ